MAQKKAVESPEAPAADGGYAQALELKDFTRVLFVSGQIPQTRGGSVPVAFREQCLLVWRNVEAQLVEAGMSLDDLVKITTYLSARRYSAENSAIRTEVLGDREIALTVVITEIYDPKWLLEIEATAAV